MYVFVTKKAPSALAHLVLFILLLPTLIFAPTHFGIVGFNLANCDREVIEGVLVYYGYIVEALLTLWALAYGLYSAVKRERSLLGPISFVTLGVTLFLLAFSSGNIVGSFSDNWSIGQYGLFGMPIFVALLGYTIVKFKTFNVKLLGTQALVVAICLLTFSLLFVRTIESIRIVVVITLSMFLVLGYQLIKSVRKEIEAKELIQTQKDQLEKANARLKELDTQKSEFLSFATHQIRSPLASMKGYASLILEGDAGPVTPELKKVVETMLTSTKTLSSVVDDYLNITRIELGTMKYDLKPIDFKDLVAEVVNEQKPNIEEKGLSFDVTIDQTQSYPIKADLDKFKQVIMNVVDNSVKYTPEGSLSISLAKDATKGIVRFTVSDTGVGIAPDVMPKLFRKFSRANNASEANIHGTGLGLFIAKEIVTAHGGRVWAESEGEGKGSRFIVEVPESSDKTPIVS